MTATQENLALPEPHFTAGCDRAGGIQKKKRKWKKKKKRRTKAYVRDA